MQVHFTASERGESHESKSGKWLHGNASRIRLPGDVDRERGFKGTPKESGIQATRAVRLGSGMRVAWVVRGFDVGAVSTLPQGDLRKHFQSAVSRRCGP
eukprot:3218029-Amphidinium_carterae.4